VGYIAHFVTVFQTQVKASGARRIAAALRGTVMLEELRDALNFNFIRQRLLNKTQLLDNYANREKECENGRILSLRLCIRTTASPEAHIRVGD